MLTFTNSPNFIKVSYELHKLCTNIFFPPYKNYTCTACMDDFLFYLPAEALQKPLPF